MGMLLRKGGFVRDLAAFCKTLAIVIISYGWHLRFDSHTLLPKTLLIQHVIGLIQADESQHPSVNLSALDQVHDRSWSSDNDHSLHRSVALNRTRDRRLDGQSWNELTNSANNALDLSCQFSTWGKAQGLWHIWLGKVESRQDGDDEGGSLSGTGLRLSDHVSWRVAEKKGEGFLLDLRWLLVVHRVKSLQDVLIETEFFEC